MKNPFVWLLALPLLAACPSPTDAGTDGSLVGDERRAGIIESQHLRAPALAAPATVTAGQTFQVAVTTLGYSGCWRNAGEDVTNAAGLAIIHPYDRVQGEVCTDALVEIRHVVFLRFDTPGTAKLVVQGRSDPNEPSPRAVTIEHTVTVQ
ncbi:MAG TPA: hypothetical protein VGB15_05455 [Longimicrobium sp.]|jgi:nitroreductase